MKIHLALLFRKLISSVLAIGYPRIGYWYWAPKITLISNETKIFFIPISDQRIFNLKKFQTSIWRQVLEICILFKKKSIKIKTIGEGAGMTDDRIRVTKVFEAVNKKMAGKGKRKIERGNRRSKTKWILSTGSDVKIFFYVMGFSQKIFFRNSDQFWMPNAEFMIISARKSNIKVLRDFFFLVILQTHFRCPIKIGKYNNKKKMKVEVKSS